MKKLKSLLYELIAIGFILALVFIPSDHPYKPWLFVLPILVSATSLIYHFRYKKRVVKNEVRFSTQNDDYSKLIPLLFGVALFAVGFVLWYWFQLNWLFIGFIVFYGILLVFSAFNKLPHGCLYIKEGKVYTQVENVQQAMELSALASIQISTSSLSLISKEGKQYPQLHLHIQPQEIARIATFVQQQIGEGIVEMNTDLT